MTIPTTSRADRILARCRQLALCTEVEGETTRTFLAPSMHQVHQFLGDWMRDAGMQVHVDAIGNLRGLLPGPTPNAPRLFVGSHLDTVANAGAFDGILGVILGLALVEGLAPIAPLPFAVEVIGFSEEEGVRFSKPFLGSLALIGQLDSATLDRSDHSGITVAQAIRNFGLDPTDLASATLHPSSIAYLEFHIEQGPVLESENRSLAVVHSIAGQTRLMLTFTGHANHAGTTPMGPLRHDAFAAAAEWAVAVEQYALQTPGLVATIGKVEIPSAAGNVIPGACTATLDVRHPNDSVRLAAVHHFLDRAAASASARGVIVAHATSLDQPAVPMDAALTTLLNAAATRATNTPPPQMTSGAGHDAMIVARRLPCAMLFLRSPGGLSHHPDESVLPADVEAAVATGLEFLRLLRDDRAMLDQLAASVTLLNHGGPNE